MKNGNAVSLISRIREMSNRFIIHELEQRGIKGIVPSHGDIFTVLFQEEKCGMTELAERIHRTKPTVTVLVDKLVDMGYVIKEKSPHDNRSAMVRLTEKGHELQPILQEISTVLNAVVYDELTEKEAETFESMLRKVYHLLLTTIN